MALVDDYSRIKRLIDELEATVADIKNEPVIFEYMSGPGGKTMRQHHEDSIAKKTKRLNLIRDFPGGEVMNMCRDKDFRRTLSYLIASTHYAKINHRLILLNDYMTRNNLTKQPSQ